MAGNPLTKIVLQGEGIIQREKRIKLFQTKFLQAQIPIIPLDTKTGLPPDNQIRYWTLYDATGIEEGGIGRFTEGHKAMIFYFTIGDTSEGSTSVTQSKQLADFLEDPECIKLLKERKVRLACIDTDYSPEYKDGGRMVACFQVGGVPTFLSLDKNQRRINEYIVSQVVSKERLKEIISKDFPL